MYKSVDIEHQTLFKFLYSTNEFIKFNKRFDAIHNELISKLNQLEANPALSNHFEFLLSMRLLQKPPNGEI